MTIHTSLRVAGLASASLLLGLFAPEAARACSAPACTSARVLLPTEAHVPVNVTTFSVQEGIQGGESAGITGVRLIDAEIGTELAVELRESNIVINGAMEPGRTYKLEVSSGCGDTITTTIEAEDAAPIPTELGTLTVGSPRQGRVPAPSSQGSCYQEVDAVSVRFSVQGSEAVQPYWDLLVWETLVDGVPYRPRGTISPSNMFGSPGLSTELGGSWFGRGEDVVYAACGDRRYEGVAQGSHEVVLRATVPGTDIELETAPVTIDLRCDVTPPPPPPPPESSAASCSATPVPGSTGALALVAVVAIGLVLRRRR